MNMNMKPKHRESSSFAWSGVSLATLLSLGFGVFFLLVTGCGTEEKTQDLGTFDGLYNSYLGSCADCHNPNNDAFKKQVPGFDMTSADAAYDSLLQFVNIERRSGCESVRYVAAGSPAQSFLIAILDTSVNSSFQASTGADCRPLLHALAQGGVANTPSAEVLSGLKNWISAGAKR